MEFVMIKQILFVLWLALPLLGACQSAAPLQSGNTSGPMRGVWLTNIASDALFSKEKLEAAVALCDSLGFNHIFVVTWNDATTTYPSKVMEQLTGVAIQPELAGRDPLAELITAAHARGIKVHAWFEFGFSCSYKKDDGGPIIAARPHWAARDQHGKIAAKNNFQWMNAFHPEVQDFITALIMELVHNYAIDGIQGDDRLPAQPSNVGYDDYTVGLYRQAHGAQDPPRYEQDYQWIKWRSGLLNDYLQRLTNTIRAVRPGIIISMAPSIYPWSEAEYLQDWPTWINMGWIDWVIPQVYRYQMERYEYELTQITKRQVAPEKQAVLFPGILLQVDQYNPSPEFLDQMIKANRRNGYTGEVFFFFEGLKKLKDYFRQTPP
jgi:uncharacterized lipoprotein YddW (UPF0748 family)